MGVRELFFSIYGVWYLETKEDKSMNKILGLVVFTIIAFFFNPAIVFADSIQKITVMAEGVAVNDSRQIGDEEMVPAVKVLGEVWSLEFSKSSDAMQVLLIEYKKIPTGNRVVVVGVPKVYINKLGSLVRVIQVIEFVTTRHY